MYQLQKWNKKFLATIFACTLPVSLVHASGFRIPEVTVTGIATSNALVATTDELGSIAYNPAAISFHDGKHVMLGLNRISYETTVTPNVATSPSNGTSVTGVGEDKFLIPNLLVSATGENNAGFALLVNSPFGLETKWPAGTFGFPGATSVLEPALSRIKMFNVNPNFSYKADENNSVAFGIDYYDVVDLQLNSQVIPIRGTGNGIGFNIGTLHKLGNNFSFGLSYRSSVTTSIKGSFDGSGVGQTIMAASAKVEFPDIFQIGVQYKPTDNIGIEVNADRTGWNSFGDISVTNSTGTVLTTSSNNWKNSWAYRLGFNWKINSGTKLMLGYAYDNTPQPDSHFSARVPDADRQLYSIGASHDFTDWKIEYAYMYVDVDDRTHNSATAYAGGDANGTNAYNGTYESKVSLIGISASMKF